ncbi:hypothetical protein TWF173_004818 [Orbilia oligospora]|nr:hypothetical protein TWF173_004818 [Orbilia oligospora]
MEAFMQGLTTFGNGRAPLSPGSDPQTTLSPAIIIWTMESPTTEPEGHYKVNLLSFSLSVLKFDRWAQVLPGDDCHILADVDGVPLADFLLWNPALARDCYGPKVGFGYCTENKGVIPTATSRVTTLASSGTSTCPSVSCAITVTITKTVFVTTSATNTSATTTKDCRYPYSADACPVTSDDWCTYNCAVVQVPYRLCQTSLQTIQASCTPCLYSTMTTSRLTTSSTPSTTTTTTTTTTPKTPLAVSMFPGTSGTS